MDRFVTEIIPKNNDINKITVSLDKYCFFDTLIHKNAYFFKKKYDYNELKYVSLNNNNAQYKNIHFSYDTYNKSDLLNDIINDRNEVIKIKKKYINYLMI